MCLRHSNLSHVELQVCIFWFLAHIILTDGVFRLVRLVRFFLSDISLSIKWYILFAASDRYDGVNQNINVMLISLLLNRNQNCLSGFLFITSMLLL